MNFTPETQSKVQHCSGHYEVAQGSSHPACYVSLMKVDVIDHIHLNTHHVPKLGFVLAEPAFIIHAGFPKYSAKYFSTIFKAQLECSVN